MYHRTTLFTEPRTQEEIVFDGEGITDETKPENISQLDRSGSLVAKLKKKNIDKIFLNKGKTRLSGNTCVSVETQLIE